MSDEDELIENLTVAFDRIAADPVGQGEPVEEDDVPLEAVAGGPTCVLHNNELAVGPCDGPLRSYLRPARIEDGYEIKALGCRAHTHLLTKIGFERPHEEEPAEASDLASKIDALIQDRLDYYQSQGIEGNLAAQAITDELQTTAKAFGVEFPFSLRYEEGDRFIVRREEDA